MDALEIRRDAAIVPWLETLQAFATTNKKCFLRDILKPIVWSKNKYT